MTNFSRRHTDGKRMEKDPLLLATATSGTLRRSVEHALDRYITQLDGQPVTNLYELVLTEVEAPLLERVQTHTGGNQSKSARMLGLNRGTLRKKLKKYGLI